MATRKTEDTDAQDKLPKSQQSLEKTIASQQKADGEAAQPAKPLTAKQQEKYADEQAEAVADAQTAREQLAEQSANVGDGLSLDYEENQPEPVENPTNTKPVSAPVDDNQDDLQAALDKQAQEALVTNPPTAVIPPADHETSEG